MLGYLFSQTGDLLQITSCSSGDFRLTKYYFLCSSATKTTYDSCKELLL